jgi:hypothetical protein
MTELKIKCLLLTFEAEKYFSVKRYNQIKQNILYSHWSAGPFILTIFWNSFFFVTSGMYLKYAENVSYVIFLSILLHCLQFADLLYDT